MSIPVIPIPLTMSAIDKLTQRGMLLQKKELAHIYKYCDIDTAKRILSGNTLKYSSVLSFNDPFEFSNFYVNTSFDQDDIKKWMLQIAEINGDSRSVAKKNLSYFKSKPEKIKIAIRNVFNEVREVTGVTCFSKSKDNCLMWSHYADKHKGICLEFDFTEINNITPHFFGVHYINKIVPVNYFKERDIMEYVLMCTKSSIWSYEQEVRSLATNFVGIKKFDPLNLSSITFGLRSSLSDKTELKNILSEKYKHAKIYHTHVNEGSFDIMFL